MEKILYESPDPAFRENIAEKLTRQFFMKLMDFHLTKIESGWVEGELLIEQKHLQQHYFVHGGVMATVADIVMGFSAYTLCRKGQGVVTADLKINYLLPATKGKILALGRVRKAGSKLFFCEAEIWAINGEERLLTNTAESLMSVVEI
jgi:uncharacterized protein (TIGR00369 family)